MITDDPEDPLIRQKKPNGQNEAYLVLPDEERSRKWHARPVRREYAHRTCQTTTTMGSEIAETFARDPKFYSSTFCVKCSKHFPVSEFVWAGTTEQVGS